MRITLQPLTPEAFKPFGDVLMGLVPEGPERQNFAARIQNGRPSARLNVTYMRIALTPLPLTLDHLEQHPHSNQVFAPLAGTQQAVVVCPSGAEGEPDLARVQGFLAGGGQAVNYHARVWHAPRSALCAPGEFVMLRWDCGDAEDTLKWALPEPIEVVAG